MKLEPRFTEDQIGATVRRVAGEISESYRDACPLLVGVLKGSFVFLADLVRELTIPFQYDPATVHHGDAFRERRFPNFASNNALAHLSQHERSRYRGHLP